MPIHLRDGHGAMEPIALAMLVLGVAVTAGCASVPAQYAAAMATAQRDAEYSMRLQDELRQKMRVGRFDEARRNAEEITERERAKLLRCADDWRMAEEMNELVRQGRYREVEQMARRPRPLHLDCSGRPLKNVRDRSKEVESARWQVENDFIGGREQLYVAPRDLQDSESDLSLHGEVTAEVRSLMTNAYKEMAVGDLATAEQTLKHALALVREVRGAADPAAGGVLLQLSWLAERRGQRAEATRDVEAAIALVEQALGSNARALAPLLQQKAKLLARTGDTERAVEVGKRALLLHSDAGESSMAYAVGLNNMGVVFHFQGDTRRALESYQGSLQILKQRVPLGPTAEAAMIEWQVPSILSNIGLAYWQRGDLQQAHDAFIAAHEALAALDYSDVHFQTERGALARAQDLAVELDAFITLEREIGAAGKGVHGVALETLLDRKGAVLDRQRHDMGVFRKGAGQDSSQRQGDVQTRSASPPAAPRRLEEVWERLQGRGSQVEDQALLAELESVLARRSALAQRKAATPDAEAAQRNEAAALDLQIRAMQVAIAESGRMVDGWGSQSPGPGASSGIWNRFPSVHQANSAGERPLRQGTLQSIQLRLRPNAALLEFVRYRPLDPRVHLPEERRWGTPRYGGYLVRHVGEPLYIDFGEAQPIEKLITDFRRALGRPGDAKARELGRRLDALLVQPLRRQLDAVKELVVAPEGVLNLIPFGALVDEENRFLIQSYRFDYVASGRDLLRTGSDAKPRSPPLILADPAFDDERPLVASSRTTAPTTQPERSRDFSGIRFAPLPGTAAEAEALKRILPDARILTGFEATETVLKKVKGPRILHIATHGFFLEDLDAGTGPSGARPRTHLAEDPMLRSGLALAGANALRSGDDDGVLTALEAAGLDLNGTKLVVLSACETGVGEVKNGEGVFGLRRAFRMAGAETVVVSLWAVADRATKDLMSTFHRLLAGGEGSAEALRQAQLELQRDPRRSHPFYWASFISSGGSE